MHKEYNTLIQLRLTDRLGQMIGFLMLPRSARLVEIEPQLRALGACHVEVLGG